MKRGLTFVSRLPLPGFVVGLVEVGEAGSHLEDPRQRRDVQLTYVQQDRSEPLGSSETGGDGVRRAETSDLCGKQQQRIWRCWSSPGWRKTSVYPSFSCKRKEEEHPETSYFSFSINNEVS